MNAGEGGGLSFSSGIFRGSLLPVCTLQISSPAISKRPGDGLSARLSTTEHLLATVCTNQDLCTELRHLQCCKKGPYSSLRKKNEGERYPQSTPRGAVEKIAEARWA